MTVYQAISEIPAERRKALAAAGVLPGTVERDLCVYERFAHLREAGLSRMDAYTRVGQECHTCEENVRKIVRRMQEFI